MKPRILAGSLLLCAFSCNAADLYRVAGNVTNAQTGSPLPRAEVYVYRSVGAKPLATLTTGENGHFSFDLPEGSYVLRAGTRTTSQTYGRRDPASDLGSAVIVGPGHDASNLTFQWFPTAAISGRVLDNNGEPVEGALVQLVRSAVVSGKRNTATMRWERTSDLGEYRFGWLPGSVGPNGISYYLAVTGTPWYAGTLQLTQPESRPPAFIPVYYPNTPDAARAAAITVKPGDEAHADFSLAPTLGGTVTVKHNTPAGTQGTIGLVHEGIAGNESLQENQGLYSFSLPEQKNSEQKFSGVPPGRYTVEITGRSGTIDVAGRASVDVNGNDVTVEIAVRPEASVTGTVTLKDPAAKFKGTPVAALVRQDNGAVIGANIHPDGTFSFPGLSAGKYKPAIRTSGIFADRIEVTGVPFRNGIIELTEGDTAKISMVASTETGNLSGLVMQGDKPAPAVLAVLAPADPADLRLSHYGYQTESDGSFDFRNLPAGRYIFFAVEDTSFEYSDPAALRPWLPEAKTITIEPHGAITERLTILPAKPR